MQAGRRPQAGNSAGQAAFTADSASDPAAADRRRADGHFDRVGVCVSAMPCICSLVDAVYFVVTTATTTGYGDISLKDTADWLKLFGCVVMLTGGALLGILFSYLAAVATAERLDETMSRQAGRMRGHIVVAGLGNLGYRVRGICCDLGLEVAVLDLAPRPRFAEALRARAPVLAGDASLPDNLERVSVATASAFLACTSDDLANIQACLHARRLNPQITTVARIFDDALAEQISAGFAIDQALSALRPPSAPLSARRPMNWPCVPYQSGPAFSGGPVSAGIGDHRRGAGRVAGRGRPCAGFSR